MRFLFLYKIIFQ